MFANSKKCSGGWQARRPARGGWQAPAIGSAKIYVDEGIDRGERKGAVSAICLMRVEHTWVHR